MPSARRPRLVATDLDGTLLRSDGTVSARTARVLTEVGAAGVETVLVTARPPRWLHDLEHIVGDHGTVLCTNGAFVYDVPTRTVLSERGFSREEVLALVADLRNALPGVGFSAERACGPHVDPAYVSPHAEDAPGVVIAPIDEIDDALTGKLLATLPGMPGEEFLERVAEVVGDRGVVAFSGVAGLAEIGAPGVTKAAALVEWCDRLGISPDEVWAFGDMPNDLPMLEWAGVSFAVANAHPDVRALADHTCPSNDEDGVAQTLERLLH